MAYRAQSMIVDLTAETPADLIDINDLALADGAYARVQSNESDWRINRSSVAAPNGTTVIDTNSSNGRWLIVSALVSTPIQIYKFSGVKAGPDAGSSSSFVADDATSGYGFAIGYPIPVATTSATLRVNANTNTRGTNSTVTVYKNGVATICTVTVPAVTSSVFTNINAAVAFAVNDLLDLVITVTNAHPETALSIGATVILS